MSAKPIQIVSLPGDGIGPEVCREALRVLEIACAHAGRSLDVVELPIGGVALDAGEDALPERTRIAAQKADAVLLGAVGLPKYDGQPGNRRPEKGLLDLRKALGVYANLRPVRAIPALAGAVSAQGGRARGRGPDRRARAASARLLRRAARHRRRPRLQHHELHPSRGAARRQGRLRAGAPRARSTSTRSTRPTCSRRRSSGAPR